MDSISTILVNALYLLIIINPVSKIVLLCPSSPNKATADLANTAVKATGVAAGILLLTIACGDFILHSVFRVNLPALQLAGGFVLFWVGFNALRRGVFFETEITARFADLAIVPLACPLIAGPATITATLTLNAGMPFIPLLSAIALALLANLGLMMCATPIGKLLMRFNGLGALIRLTGLIVMTMGTEMMTNGIANRFGFSGIPAILK